MTQYATDVRNAKLNAIETTIGTDPIMRGFGAAAMPANPAAADAGTQLFQATLPTDWMADAASGQKALLGTWQDAAADATGLARYYRIYESTGTTCKMQGLISMDWEASTAYALNTHVSNGGNVYVCTTAGTSAGSGGPTGTGTGISDGTAVWDFVGVEELVLQNVSIGSGQSVTITAFTITEGNA